MAFPGPPWVRPSSSQGGRWMHLDVETPSLQWLRLEFLPQLKFSDVTPGSSQGRGPRQPSVSRPLWHRRVQTSSFSGVKTPGRSEGCLGVGAAPSPRGGEVAPSQGGDTEFWRLWAKTGVASGTRVEGEARKPLFFRFLCCRPPLRFTRSEQPLLNF